MFSTEPDPLRPSVEQLKVIALENSKYLRLDTKTMNLYEELKVKFPGEDVEKGESREKYQYYLKVCGAYYAEKNRKVYEEEMPRKSMENLEQATEQVWRTFRMMQMDGEEDEDLEQEEELVDEQCNVDEQEEDLVDEQWLETEAIVLPSAGEGPLESQALSDTTSQDISGMLRLGDSGSNAISQSTNFSSDSEEPESLPFHEPPTTSTQQTQQER